MAFTKKGSSLVEDFNSLNLFGKCQREDIIFKEDEEKERERKFLEAERERKRELRRQKDKEKKDELAYDEFLRELKLTKNPPVIGRGRGSLLTDAFSGGSAELKSRGRGRLTPQEKESLHLFEREKRVETNLTQFAELKCLHNNIVQKQIWTGCNSNNDEDEEDYYAESSSTSEQYEDAEDSPFTGSPMSFNSVRSHDTDSASPALEPPPPSPQPRPSSTTDCTKSPSRPRTRGSRIAAKFSNSEPIKDQDDPLSVLGSSRAPIARKIGNNSGSFFDSMNASKRVLSNDVLRPEDVYANARTNGFVMNIEDFPAL